MRSLTVRREKVLQDWGIRVGEGVAAILEGMAIMTDCLNQMTCLTKSRMALEAINLNSNL